ncbi:MAG: hypothetical protein UY05_C0069G0004 [Candidatus Peregrinibacteria bacterium GW2011_GWA2_47_7]|nr:MAG: hypothetical protein UY05_C0069G0004 [Candidatus Peregrinibacteria bacterium GW2011_GWA2_47_7]
MLWFFVFNTGEVEVSGETPFIVSIGSERDFVCEKSPCGFELKPKKYTINARKEGFLDETVSLEVNRGKVKEVKLVFQYIPRLVVSGAFELPAKLAAVENNFTGVTVTESVTKLLQKIPATADIIIFGNHQNNAVVHLGKEIYLAGFDTAQSPFLVKSAFKPEQSPTFVDDRVLVFETEGEVQKLYRYPISDESPETITTFKRPIIQPEVFVESTGKRVLVVESMQFEKTAYLVDLEKKSRRVLPLPKDFSRVRFVKDGVVLYGITTVAGDQKKEANGEPIQENVFLFDFIKNKTLELPLDDFNTLLPFEDGFVFLSSVNLEDDGSNTSEVTFEEILETTSPLDGNGVFDTADKKTAGQFVYMTYLNVEDNRYSTLATITMDEGQKISRLELDELSGRILLVKGSEVWALLLKPVSQITLP